MAPSIRSIQSIITVIRPSMSYGEMWRPNNWHDWIGKRANFLLDQGMRGHNLHQCCERLSILMTKEIFILLRRMNFGNKSILTSLIVEISDS